MPRWNDGESSNESYLPDLKDMDYAPDMVDDTRFCGIALGCPEVCRIHKLQLRKCVAFQGTDTSRKFYMCQIENQAMNCGFHS
ncbi:hypothetical protein ACQ4PT_071224 [Festuca glaucescens]